MKNTLIYIDQENIINSIELLEVARQIHADQEYQSFGLLINQQIENKYLGEFDSIINIKDQNIKSYDQLALTDVIEELQNEYQFESIIIPATHIGRMLAPRLAMRLHVGLVADVTEIKKDEKSLELIRPAFSGRIMAGIETNAKKPIMLTVRQNVFTHHIDQNKELKMINYQPNNYNKAEIDLLEKKQCELSYDIRESEILVSGGGGALKDFEQIKNLADKLNAEVSASRKIIDDGKASRNIQVGQSGKTVSPELYIALGISGAIEHVAGLKNIENIISVNINKNAPICSLSDIVVVGDAIEFVKKLSNKLEKN